MAPYYPVTICRSDGLQNYLEKGRQVANEPKNQDSTPNAERKVNFYVKLGPDDPRTVQWKRKLGGLLMDEISGDEHKGKEFILKELPEGYTLWQHQAFIDKTEEEKRIEKQGEGGRGSSHAASGLSRSDTYLYGYPGGKTKRFRSPLDFLPHLLWLAKDKEGDKQHCTCKLCTPGSRSSVTKHEDVKDVKVEKEEKKDKIIPTTAYTTSVGTQRANISAEQAFDSQPDGVFMYRPGELVWFSRGSAWGLAVISKRRVLNSAPQYLLQPLSHPLRHPASQIKNQDEIRPWLAWSLPATTHKTIATLTYEQVNWEGLLAGSYGSDGDPEVDGSILAAKAIDASYTLFDRVDVLGSAPGEVYYSGMFLGGEKVWTGEPVRLRVPGDEPTVLIIQRMKERTDAMGNSLVTIIGDVYKFVEMPTLYNSRKEWPPSPNLPARMVADMRFRNEVADNAKAGVWREWRLLDTMAQKSLTDIKGRWYETRTLLPILRGVEVFNTEIRRGIAADTGLFLNGRGDSSGGGTGQRKKNRLDTLGKAVPSDLKISRGLNGPREDNVFPDELSTTIPQPPHNNGNQFAGTHGDIDQFMDLDGVEQQNFYGNGM